MKAKFILIMLFLMFLSACSGSKTEQSTPKLLKSEESSIKYIDDSKTDNKEITVTYPYLVKGEQGPRENTIRINPNDPRANYSKGEPATVCYDPSRPADSLLTAPGGMCEDEELRGK